MLFFLNDNIQTNMSGIEHAQVERLRLFRSHNHSAKIVTRQYSNELHTVTRAAGIKDEDFVNLFDYFQDAVNIEDHKVTIQDLHLDPRWKRKSAGDSYNFYQGKERMVYVRRAADHHVMNEQFFDRYGKLIKVSWYDHRGFLSVDQLYDWDGNINTQNYFRPDGSLAIQLTNHKNMRGKQETSYHLFNYKGHDYQFPNFAELTRFFYDELVQDERYTNGEPVGLIIDRSFEVGWAVMNMKHRVFRLLQLHNAHLNDPDDIIHSTLNFNYTWALNNINDWDGVISLTEYQLGDLEKRWPDVKFYRIPGPIVPDEQLNAPHIPFNKRQKDLVVTIARLSPEKQQDQLLKVWPDVLKAVPDAKLELWGYANDNFDKKLKQIIKDEDITKSVTLKGYSENIAQVEDKAQLMVLPSRAEGLPLVLVEAISHGLPAVANDIKYGPRDVIVDQKSGILTQNGDLEGLKQAIITLLTDQDRLAKMSEFAYQDSQRYSEDTVMGLWEQVIEDVRKWQKAWSFL